MKYSEFPERSRIDRINCFPIRQLNTIKQGIFFKPSGWWYAFGDEWLNFWNKDFYQDKEWEKNRAGSSYDGSICSIKIPKKCYTTLDKKEKDKILVLSSLDEILQFQKLYSKQTRVGKFKSTKILYDKVSTIYCGIEFRNFEKNRKKLEKMYGDDPYKSDQYIDYPNWYNTLDVASGCIWDFKPLIGAIDVEMVQESSDDHVDPVATCYVNDILNSKNKLAVYQYNIYTVGEQLHRYTVKELKDMAKIAGISGFSKMKKSELVKTLKKDIEKYYKN